MLLVAVQALGSHSQQFFDFALAGGPSLEPSAVSVSPAPLPNGPLEGPCSRKRAWDPSNPPTSSVRTLKKTTQAKTKSGCKCNKSPRPGHSRRPGRIPLWAPTALLAPPPRGGASRAPSTALPRRKTSKPGAVGAQKFRGHCGPRLSDLNSPCLEVLIELDNLLSSHPFIGASSFLESFEGGQRTRAFRHPCRHLYIYIVYVPRISRPGNSFEGSTSPETNASLRCRASWIPTTS